MIMIVVIMIIVITPDDAHHVPSLISLMIDGKVQNQSPRSAQAASEQLFQ